jgi:hypothetical protein
MTGWTTANIRIGVRNTNAGISDGTAIKIRLTTIVGNLPSRITRSNDRGTSTKAHQLDQKVLFLPCHPVPPRNEKAVPNYAHGFYQKTPSF